MGEMTGGIKGGMKNLKSFVYKPFRGVMGGMRGFFIKTLQNNHFFHRFIPNLGMNCSQPGNEMFPTWE